MVSSSSASVLIRMTTATLVVVESGVFRVPSSSSSVSVVPVVAVTLAIRILFSFGLTGWVPLLTRQLLPFVFTLALVRVPC
ncbi:hypothetical protein A2U01_0070865 [Trifolium medium]|uniref:Uncharacterized protein n=1 Tax=Trifolium medium TaxID=97028 RepID=A0A392SL74_9FABA|nr:hypothetical protein [Trifolium medium]